MVKIGLLGFGTVGCGVYEIINEKKGAFFAGGESGLITKILVRDKNKKRNIDVKAELLTENFEDILNDKEISIVAALMGSYEFEYDYIVRAIKAKKNVVTANKEIIAKHIDDLLKLAKENNVDILYEASVGGGIPIIEAIVESIKINKINKIYGILNGTTNFILSKMTKEEKDFSLVLKEAQDLGFAEADPTSDVDGHDIARKLAILSTMAYGMQVNDDMIYKRPVRNISLKDIVMADNMGYIFKYLGESEIYSDDKFSASVTPVLVKKESIVANVNGEYNIISIDGHITGEQSFLGKGAGKDATANAVVQDTIKVIKKVIDYSHLTFDNEVNDVGIERYKAKFYLRVNIENEKEFDKVIDIVARNVENLNLIYENGSIFFTTPEISGAFMRKLDEKLRLNAKDVFYARIIDNI